MTDEGNPLKPVQIFKKVIWRSFLSVSSGLEQSTGWTTTGVAAIVTLLISNLDAVSKIVLADAIGWSLILFAGSLLVGALSKMIGLAVQSGLLTMNRLEELLRSEAGDNLMSAMAIEPRQLFREIAEPFVWPMSVLMARGGERGLTDYLAGEKQLVRMFCWQVYLNLLHVVLAVVAIATLALSMRASL